MELKKIVKIPFRRVGWTTTVPWVMVYPLISGKVQKLSLFYDVSDALQKSKWSCSDMLVKGGNKNSSVSSSVHLVSFRCFFVVLSFFHDGSSSGWQPSQSMNYAPWWHRPLSVYTDKDEHHHMRPRDRLLPPFTNISDHDHFDFE